jgi:hypothetical protein
MNILLFPIKTHYVDSFVNKKVVFILQVLRSLSTFDVQSHPQNDAATALLELQY